MQTDIRIQFYIFLLFTIISLHSKAQVVQLSVGTQGISEVFYDSKYDPNDGGTISVGYRNEGLGNSNDLFLVKFDANHQMVWQKTVPNSGDDNFNRVKICANGDYVAVGQFHVGSFRRGFACRINSSNGNFIWSKITTQTSQDQILWDAAETAANNIALVGMENLLSNESSSFVSLVSSNGTDIWANQSTFVNADEFRAITILPNGHLLLSGFYNPFGLGGRYNPTLTEMDETTGAILNEDAFDFNTSVPGNTTPLNSTFPIDLVSINSTIFSHTLLFQGYGYGTQEQAIFSYDISTRTANVNIYYHPGHSPLSGLGFYPLSDNDFIIASSVPTSSSNYISRITNGVIVYDKSLNTHFANYYRLNVFNNNLNLTGSINNSDVDAYNLFAPVSLINSATPCSVSDNNTLTIQSFTLNSTSTNPLDFITASAMTDITVTDQNVSYTIANVCGFVLPVQLVSFTASYKADDASALLYWSTSSEMNSSKFIIERSVDNGKHFTEIGSLSAAGTSNTLHQYNLIDIKPNEGINFYRLKQVDIDGSFKYSDTRSINCLRGKDNDYILSPVPAHNFTWLTFTGEKSQTINIAVFDAAGKSIKKQHVTIDNTHPLKLDLAGWNEGVYFIKIYSEGANIIVKKIIVE
ncbi:MAG: T9SS type A sorting domain-containing protein [Ferruginibacter sp.]